MQQVSIYGDNTIPFERQIEIYKKYMPEGVITSAKQPFYIQYHKEGIIMRVYQKKRHYRKHRFEGITPKSLIQFFITKNDNIILTKEEVPFPII